MQDVISNPLLLPELREQVWRANMDLQVHKLVTFTWGFRYRPQVWLGGD